MTAMQGPVKAYCHCDHGRVPLSLVPSTWGQA